MQTCYKNLQGFLETHGRNQYHIKDILERKHFIKVFNDPSRDVINQLNTHHLRIVKKNHERLKPIIQTLIFLEKQNIPFRGHRDDGSIFDNSNELMGNEGNFRELIKFGIESGNLKLKSHIENIESRATYISKTTQNQLISILGDSILQKILENVKISKFYSIMFDETTNMSHTSQLVIVTRYVKDNCVRKDFICFVDCHKENFDLNTEEPKITGALIGHTVLNILYKFSLDLDFCVGIFTDSCATRLV